MGQLGARPATCLVAANSRFAACIHWDYHLGVAATAQKLRIGQEVEVDGRRYEVVPDPEGGAMLEPAITLSVDEIIARSGGRRATPEEFETWFGDIPSDGEG